MESILQTRYYNLGEGNPEKISSGIKLPEAHDMGKGLDPNKQPEKQVLKPITVTKMKEVPQIKLRLGQGREGLRCKTKTPLPSSTNNPTVQAKEKQPKVLVLKIPKIQDKVVPIPNYAIPPIKSNDESGSRMVERKAIQDVIKEIPIFPDPVYRPS